MSSLEARRKRQRKGSGTPFDLRARGIVPGTRPRSGVDSRRLRLAYILCDDLATLFLDLGEAVVLLYSGDDTRVVGTNRQILVNILKLEEIIIICEIYILIL